MREVVFNIYQTIAFILIADRNKILFKCILTAKFYGD